MTPEEQITAVQARVLLDAFLEGSARYWERRARQLEAARPRQSDFTGSATPDDLSAQWERLTAAASACRSRATGVDGCVTVDLLGAFEDLAAGVAA